MRNISLKKKLTRALSIGLASVMSAAILSSCGGGNTSSPADTTAKGADPAVTTAAKPGDIPTITWWTIGGTLPSDFDEGIKTINEYLAEKIGVKIDIKLSSWGDWEKKMTTIVNSGEKYDMMYMNNNFYSRFIKMGAYADITDSVQTVTPDLYKFVPETLWKGVQNGGRIYGVPTYKDSSIAQFWCFDDKYVQKYKIDVPNIKTLQDLDAPFRAMKEGEGKGYYPLQLSQASIFSGFFNDYDGLTAGLFPIGVNINDQTRKVVSVFEQPEVMTNLKLLHSWYKDGIINPDANVVTEAPKGLPFFTAQGWPGAATVWQTLNGVEKYDLVKVFGPLYSTESIQGSINVISSASPNKDACLKVLEFANTDHKFRDMLAYGVEGKNFEYVSENVVKQLNDSWVQGLAKYTQATFFNMSTTEDSDPNQWVDVQKQNEDATSSSCLGFALDITNVQNEVANCRTAFDKYKFDLLTGASDPEVVLPNIMKELKAAGLDTIIAEAQKQIDEFFK